MKARGTTRREPGTRWVVAAAIAAAAVSVVLAVAPLLGLSDVTRECVTTVGSASASGTSCTSHPDKSWISAHGWRGVGIVAVPAGLGLLPLATPVRRRRRVAAGAAILLGGVVILAAASIGLLYLPAAVLMAVAARRLPPRSPAAGAMAGGGSSSP